MPTYEYYCTKCGYKTEHFKTMDSPHLTECPECNLETLVQDYSSISVAMEISEPKTIGDLADKNTERMVSEGKLDKKSLEYDRNKERKKKKKERMKKIANMTPSQKDKYIITGDEN
jgi:putative FmdB family regulatory protein